MFTKLRKKATLKSRSSKGSYSFSADTSDDSGVGFSVSSSHKQRNNIDDIIAGNTTTGKDHVARTASSPASAAGLESSTPYITDGTHSNDKLHGKKNARFSTFFEDARSGFAKDESENHVDRGSKGSPTLKKGKAPPPPPKRGCSLSSIPIDLEISSNSTEDGGSSYSGSQQNGYATLQHRRNRHSIESTTPAEPPQPPAEDDDTPRPARPQSVPPLDLSFVERQPASIDTVRSASSNDSAPGSSGSNRIKHVTNIQVNGTDDITHTVQAPSGTSQYNGTSHPVTSTVKGGVSVSVVSGGGGGVNEELPSLRAAMARKSRPSAPRPAPAPVVPLPNIQALSTSSNGSNSARSISSDDSASSSTPRDQYGNPVAPPRSRSKTRNSGGSKVELHLETVAGSDDSHSSAMSRSRNSAPRGDFSAIRRPTAPPPALPGASTSMETSQPPSAHTNGTTNTNRKDSSRDRPLDVEVDSVYSSDYDPSYKSPSYVSELMNNGMPFVNGEAGSMHQPGAHNVDQSPRSGVALDSVRVDTSNGSTRIPAIQQNGMYAQDNAYYSMETVDHHHHHQGNYQQVHNDLDYHNPDKYHTNIDADDNGDGAVLLTAYHRHHDDVNGGSVSHQADSGYSGELGPHTHGYGSSGSGLLDIPHIPLDLADLRLEDGDDDSDITGAGGDEEHHQLHVYQKPVCEWNCDDIADWCRSLDMHLFADIFEDSVVDGNVLLQIEDADLVDLEINDPAMRNQFMNELTKLKHKENSRAKKSKSSHDDQLESDVDDVLGSVHMESVHQDDERVPANSTREQSTHLHDVPLASWSTQDVLLWLQTSGLDKFLPSFHSHAVTGKDLSHISLQLLDEIGVRTTEDRELILSKLYELQNPSRPPVHEILHAPPSLPPSLPPPVASASAPTHPSGPPPPPPQSYDTVDPPKDFATDDSAPNSDRSEKSRNRSIKKRESFQKMKGLVPQKLFGTQEKNVMDMTIWHDLQPEGNNSTDVKIDETMTSHDVIRQVLERYDVIADSRLHYLVQIHITDSNKDRVLLHTDHPLDLIRSWEDDSSSYKVVLQCEAGTQLYITAAANDAANVDEARRGGKETVISVAMTTTCSDVINMCAQIHGLTDEAGDLVLVPQRDGSRQLGSPLKPNDSPAKQHTQNLLLCHKKILHQENSSANTRSYDRNTQSEDAIDMQTDTSVVKADDNLCDAKADDKEAKTRHSRMSRTEQHITKQTTTTVQSAVVTSTTTHEQQHHSTTNTATGSTSNTQNNTANSATALSKSHNTPQQRTPRTPPGGASDARDGGGHSRKPAVFTSMDDDVASDEHLELLREIALMKDSLGDRDGVIHDYKQSNILLKDKMDQLSARYEALQQQMRDHQSKEKDYTAACTDMKHTIKLLNLQLAIIKGDISSSRAGEALQAQLHEVTDKVTKQRAMVQDLQTHRSADVGLLQKAEEMLMSLTKEEAHLYNEQQVIDNATNYLKYEKSKRSGFALTQVVPVESTDTEGARTGTSSELVHTQLRAGTDGKLGFTVGRDQRGLPVVVKVQSWAKCVQEGDLIVEVNGTNLMTKSDDDLEAIMRQASQSQFSILLLRKKEPITSQHVSEEELNAVKEDLSLAVMEVESLQQDNASLQHQLQQLQHQNEKLSVDNADLVETIGRLRIQANTSRAQWKELRAALRELREADQGMRNGTSGIDLLNITSLDLSPRSDDGLTLDNGPPLHHHANGNIPHMHNGYMEAEQNKESEVIAYDKLDLGVPMWESLKSLSKPEILQALKDHILETRQQKVYLDRLQALVIERAPDLLKHVDQSDTTTAIHLKENSEEFC